MNNAYPLVIEGQREATASLLAKVLAITSLGFLVTAVGVATAPPWSALPGIIAVFALIFSISFARRKSPALALGLFLLLTYFMGWEIGPLIQHYIRSFGPGLVLNAAVTTGLGMACMGIVAYLFNINYRAISGIAFALLLGVLLIGIVSMFFQLPLARHLFLDDPRRLHPPYYRRLRPHPRRRRRPVRRLTLPLHLSGRHQHLPCRPPAPLRPPPQLGRCPISTLRVYLQGRPRSLRSGGGQRMHEYAPVLIMLIAVSYGIFSNKSDLKELRLEMRSDLKSEVGGLRAEINSRFDNFEARMDRFESHLDRFEAKQDRMQADLSDFHRSLGQHNKAAEMLEKRK